MDEDGWGFAVDAELQGGLQAAIAAAAQAGRDGSAETSARPDTISAAGNSSPAAHGPGFVVPPDLDGPSPQDSPAGTMTFVGPPAFALVDLAGAGLPPGALLAPPDPFIGMVATLENMPAMAGAIAILHDGTTLSFADFAPAPN